MSVIKIEYFGLDFLLFGPLVDFRHVLTALGWINGLGDFKWVSIDFTFVIRKDKQKLFKADTKRKD